MGLAAEEIIDGSPIRFSLLKALDYDLNLTTGTSIGRLFANVQFSVNKSDLANTDYYSFFLNQNVTMEHVQVNGVETRYNITTNLHPKHFIPELHRPELLDGSMPVNCISFDAGVFADLPEQINISLEYWLFLPGYSSMADGREAFLLGDIPFLFPRNISESSQVNLQLTTTIFHAMDSALSTSDRGGIRNIRANIIDIPTEDIRFNIYKLN
jgi:hypothetical protein